MRSVCLGRAISSIRTRTRTRTQISSLCSSPSPPSGPSVAALKNVTKSNFEPALAELRRHVREADFVAIDLEMTGITSAPWRQCFEFDPPDIQYLKIKNSAEKFAVVQFGVCPFRWDSQINSFVAYPYNFYIFPQQEIPGEFLCQTSSLEFLAKHQFDFNQCIYEGISYLSRSQEEEALGRFDFTHDDDFSDTSSHGVDKQSIRMADILFAERMKNIISGWYARLLLDKNSVSEFEGGSGNINQKFQTPFFHMRLALALKGFTFRQLTLIKSVTEKHFKDLAYVDAINETSGPQALIVKTESATDKDLLLRENRTLQGKEPESKIKAAIGFRHVIDMVSSERKLIIGHNCFLDLAHVYSKFVGPLPSTVEEFASAVQKYFPYVIDTKVLLTSDYKISRIVRANTSLFKAFGLLCQPVAFSGTSSDLAGKQCVKVEAQVDDLRFSNWGSGNKHEAGFDALMTGSIFSQACFHLGIDFNSNNWPHDTCLQRYVNHLYLRYANGHIINLKTGRSTIESSALTSSKRCHPKIVHSNMILLWGLPLNLKEKDLRDCFYCAFGVMSIAAFYHLDESAVIVQFKTAEMVSVFHELMDILRRDDSAASVLHPLSRVLEGGRVGAGGYEMYEEICHLPGSEEVFSDRVKVQGRRVDEAEESGNGEDDDETSDKESVL